MDREAWWAIVHGFAKSLTGLSDCAYMHIIYHISIFNHLGVYVRLSLKRKYTDIYIQWTIWLMYQKETK